MRRVNETSFIRKLLLVVCTAALEGLAQAQASGQRDGGHRVGRRHDCPEDEAHGQPDLRYQRMRDPSHDAHGAQYEKYSQQRDGAKVAPQLAPGGVEGRPVQQWREEDQEERFRIERQPRQAWYQGDPQSPDHQEGG